MHHQGPKPPSSDPQRRTRSAENSEFKQSSVPLRSLCGEPVAPWIPESKLPPLPQNSVNSLIRKILLTTPVFPRFYADLILALAPNSHEARTLRPHYQKILEKVIAMSDDRSCTHIKVTGVRCNSPALRGEQFCYFHQNAHRGVPRPPQSRLHPIAVIEDEESIQYALMEVINALMRNTIDVKRASLIIRALHIAVKNAARVKFGIQEPITKIPEYAAPTQEHETIAQQSELPAVSAIPYKPVEPTNPHFWEHQEEGGRILAREAAAQAHMGTAAIGTNRVGTDAEACAERSRSIRPASAASIPTPATTTTAKVAPPPTPIPPHDFKTPQPAPQRTALPHSQAAPPQSPSRRKPPETVKPSPKEKIAANNLP